MVLEEKRPFRKHADEITRTYSYNYDFTNTFEDVDVYMNVAHIDEDGNQIIAKRVWNVISELVFFEKEDKYVRNK